MDKGSRPVHEAKSKKKASVRGSARLGLHVFSIFLNKVDNTSSACPFIYHYIGCWKIKLKFFG